MSEEKKTYGNMEAEWADPRVGGQGQTSEALVASAILQLADAIRDLPRLWMEAVKKG